MRRISANFRSSFLFTIIFSLVGCSTVNKNDLTPKYKLTPSCNIEKKCGYISDEGQLIVERIYDRAFEFEGSLAVVKKDNKFGYLNDYGIEVTEIKYDYVCPVIHPRLRAAVIETSSDDSPYAVDGRDVDVMKYTENDEEVSFSATGVFYPNNGLVYDDLNADGFEIETKVSFTENNKTFVPFDPDKCNEISANVAYP